jgi:ferredoxin
MDIRAIEAFLYSKYNQVADAKMLLFFLHPTLLTVKVLVVLLLASTFIRNFWCRYLCPYGALLGLGALIGPLQVRRNASLCIQCKKCDSICPGSIRISKNGTIRHPECVGCAECVEICPVKGCLSLQAPKLTVAPLYSFAIVVVGLFAAFWAIAVLTGHWHTAISPDTLRHLYPSAGSLAHP